MVPCEWFHKDFVECLPCVSYPFMCLVNTAVKQHHMCGLAKCPDKKKVREKDREQILMYSYVLEALLVVPSTG